MIVTKLFPFFFYINFVIVLANYSNFMPVRNVL